jgi:ABC-2 type transport system permease protein
MSWLGIATIFILTLGITALGIGVGAAYPKFTWENVSKIPAGFGGIIFMVLAISYIAVLLAIMWQPVYGLFLRVLSRQPLYHEQIMSLLISGLFVLLLCVLCFVLPMAFGLQRLEEREIW